MLLAATHDWITELDKGNEMAAVFFDIKKPLVLSGIPQSSILGPFLFIIFMSDINNSIPLGSAGPLCR